MFRDIREQHLFNLHLEVLFSSFLPEASLCFVAFHALLTSCFNAPTCHRWTKCKSIAHFARASLSFCPLILFFQAIKAASVILMLYLTSILLRTSNWIRTSSRSRVSVLLLIWLSLLITYSWFYKTTSILNIQIKNKATLYWYLLNSFINFNVKLSFFTCFTHTTEINQFG